MTILVTGGAGFIGSNFVLGWIRDHDEPIVIVDKLTYAGNLSSLKPVTDSTQLEFIRADICDAPEIRSVLAEHKPRAIVHLAAETHVDRSIQDPAPFVQTNVTGTFNLLEQTKQYWSEMSAETQRTFRFLHLSTDEVYGSLTPADSPFTEQSPHAPNNPYAASKAASDHLVRAYFRTYGLPTLTARCANNYGPFQFPEKLVPLTILHCMNGERLPVYGDGLNIRDWLYVGDTCAAIRLILEGGHPGETYNIGARNEATNFTVVSALCAIMDELLPDSRHVPHKELISYVMDRPGHDSRYAVDARKLEQQLDWTPTESFATGIRKTVSWYLQNQDWVQSVTNGTYREWLAGNYGSRAPVE